MQKTRGSLPGVEGWKRWVFENFRSHFVTFLGLPIQFPLGKYVNLIENSALRHVTLDAYFKLHSNCP
jgi:hypothetical protein